MQEELTQSSFPSYKDSKVKSSQTTYFPLLERVILSVIMEKSIVCLVNNLNIKISSSLRRSTKEKGVKFQNGKVGKNSKPNPPKTVLIKYH
jgi:hypothetical protein